MANHDHPQLAPAWLPRQRRRHIDRALRKLFHRNACSFCGGPLKHNSGMATGFDAQGTVALAGACCFGRLTQVFGMGLYSDRQYDFLQPSGSAAPPEKIVEAFTNYVMAIGETDRLLADIERCGDGIRAPTVTLLDHPWKSDDKHWFKQNPSRSHRARKPFPGEVDEAVAKTPRAVRSRHGTRGYAARRRSTPHFERKIRNAG
jgi:hypothetical protein